MRDAADPIAIALKEDIGAGDITTATFVPVKRRAQARIVSREQAILAGIETAADVFRRVDPKLRIRLLQKDGAALQRGDAVLEIQGAARSILTAERVALNFLQRLSGIATLTHQFVSALGNSHTKILDTRKTTPGLRALEKAAVIAGGGANHRFDLNEMVLVKDNHLMATGFSDLAAAIADLRKKRPKIRVELEADRLDQVRGFVGIKGVDVILLDNMSPALMREAVAMGKGTKIKFEASGGVTLKNVRRIASTGVDYISVGALTHSARAIDLSLDFTNAEG